MNFITSLFIDISCSLTKTVKETQKNSSKALALLKHLVKLFMCPQSLSKNHISQTLIVFSLLFCCYSVSAQYTAEWQQHYGEENVNVGPSGLLNYPRITSINELPDGNFIVGGFDEFTGYNAFIGYWLYKIDENGNLIWETFNNEGDADKIIPLSFCLTADGGIAMTGQLVVEDLEANTPLSVIKTDDLGNFLWQQNYPLPYGENGTTIIPSDDGGFFVASVLYNGDFMNNASSSRLLRLDADGNIVWEQQLDNQISVDLTPTSDGGFLYLSFGSFATTYLKKIDGNGVIEWETEYDESDDLIRTAKSLTVTEEDEPLIIGEIRDVQEFGTGAKDVWILKADSDGNFLWEQRYDHNNSYFENGIDIKTKSNGHSVLISSYSGSSGTSDFGVVELDENGNIFQEIFYESLHYDLVQSLCVTEEDEILISGRFSENTNAVFTEDPLPWIIKLSADGEEGLELSAKIFLEGCYNEDGTMSANLTSVLPLNQPYNDAPWNYTGTESLNEIPSNMVDWVLVEARTGIPTLSSSSTGTTVVEQKAGLLLTDGSIVGLDGVADLRFLNLSEGETYYFSVRHRNHLDVLTATGVPASLQMSYDFTTAIEQAFGPDQQKPSTDGKAFLHTGDINGDGVIQVSDYDIWFENKAVLNTYHPADLNLDNVIQTTDYDAWFFNKAKIGVGELQY